MIPAIFLQKENVPRIVFTDSKRVDSRAIELSGAPIANRVVSYGTKRWLLSGALRLSEKSPTRHFS